MFNVDQKEFFNAILHITVKLVKYYHMDGSSSATGSYHQTLITKNNVYNLLQFLDSNILLTNNSIRIYLKTALSFQ